jgi:hypothetical protein
VHDFGVFTKMKSIRSLSFAVGSWSAVSVTSSRPAVQFIPLAETHSGLPAARCESTHPRSIRRW